MTEKNPNQFVTKEMLCTWPVLFEAKEDLSGKEKYSIPIIIQKDDEESMAQLKTIFKEVAQAHWGVSDLSGVTLPFIDSSETGKDKYTGYENCYYFTAKTLSKPKVFQYGNQDRSTITEVIDSDEIYSGCIVKVALHFYCFNLKSIKRIATGLDYVFKISDGEIIGGNTVSDSDVENMFNAKIVKDIF